MVRKKYESSILSPSSKKYGDLGSSPSSVGFGLLYGVMATRRMLVWGLIQPVCGFAYRCRGVN